MTKPMSDNEIGDLLHEMINKLSSLSAETEEGLKTLGVAARNLDILKTALLIKSEGLDPFDNKNWPESFKRTSQKPRKTP